MTTPQYFPESKDWNVGEINIVNKPTTTGDESKTRALERLEKEIAKEASIHSGARCDAPKCMPETRTAVQDDMTGWAVQRPLEPQSERLMWLHGPAGAGKTAIMGSVCEKCDKAGDLAGNYFFSVSYGSTNSRTKGPFIATLAFQLVQHDALGSLRPRILVAIERDGTIFDQTIEAQMERMILRPIRDTLAEGADISSWPKAIMVDGLDECEAMPIRSGAPRAPPTKEEDQVEILRSLANAAADPTFPFRIIVASRPEPAIRHFFESPELAGRFIQVALEEKYKADADIKLYLQAKVADMRRRFGLPLTWASDRDVQTLVENASGQFIYAATVVRFLQTSKKPFQERLDIVLSLRPKEKRQAFEPLDELYSTIIHTSDDPVLAVDFIFFVAIADASSKEPAWCVRRYLELELGEVDHALGHLHSLLFVPPADDFTSSFHLHHRSLLDLLRDASRCPKDLAIYAGTKYRERWKVFLTPRHLQTLERHASDTSFSNDGMRNVFEKWFVVNGTPTNLKYSTPAKNMVQSLWFWLLERSSVTRRLENCKMEWVLRQVKDPSSANTNLDKFIHYWCSPIKCGKQCRKLKAQIEKARVEATT